MIAQTKTLESLNVTTEVQPQAEPVVDYQDALDDLYALSQSIDQLLDRAGADEAECQKLYARIQEQVKCIATLHCDYHKEIFAQEDANLKRDGLKRILVPAA